MAASVPKVVVLAGPNGAGKSTVAPHLLQGALNVDEFVNADTIAQGLSAFAQERVAMQAGRIMLRRLDELAASRVSFGFETTLATRSYVQRLRRWQAEGYEVHLVFLWLPSAEVAVSRVADRVHHGGHDVPEAIIRRRFVAGLANFQKLYLPLVNSWKLFDNTSREKMTLIAAGWLNQAAEVYQPDMWSVLDQQQ